MTEVSEGISNILQDLFGEGYKIYEEDAEQNLQKPCFWITQIQASRQDIQIGRYKKEESYLIRYYPENEPTGRTECKSVGDRLLDEVAVIVTDSGMVPCTERKYEIVDGILRFTMNCNQFVNVIPVKEKMETITIQTIKVKE